MFGVILALGPICFEDFEIPSAISFGSKQLLAVHVLAGGQKVIDCLGGDNTEICFSGVFSGGAATSRARMLNSLCAAGNELDLTWDLLCYSVILSRFDADYQNPTWIPYQVVCTVVRDQATVAITLGLSLGNSVVADMQVVEQLTVGLGIDLTGVQLAMNDPKAFTLQSAAYTKTTLSINLVQSAMNTMISLGEADLLNSSRATSDPTSQQVAAIVDAAASLAMLTGAVAYIGRAARNLMNAST